MCINTDMCVHTCHDINVDVIGQLAGASLKCLHSLTVAKYTNWILLKLHLR